MRRYNFFLKLFLGNFLLIALVLIVGGWLAYRLAGQRFEQESRDKQKRVTAIARSFLEEVWSDLPAEAEGDPALRRGRIDAALKQQLRETAGNLRITVIDLQGNVLGDTSEVPAEKMVNHMTSDRGEVTGARDFGQGWDLRRSETLDRPFRYYAETITIGGQKQAIIRSAMPVRYLSESRDLIGRWVLILIAVLAISGLLLGLLVSWIWYAPLRRLTLAARSMASGSLRTRAHIRGSDELGELAQALDEMRENLARQIDLIATQRANLQTVVSTLREGIIATDRRDRVVLVNRAAYDMLDVEDHTGKKHPELPGQHVQSIVRVASIMDLYRQVCQEGQTATRQIETDVLGHMRTLQVTVTQVEPGPAEGLNALIVIHDVSDIARAAAMKSEFVANASHELRTPLATIRAAVESLATIEPNDTEMFHKLLDILARHVQRLENMTLDLLNLHVVATEDVQLHPQQLTAESLVNWVRSNYAASAAGKNIELETRTPEPKLRFESDRKLLEMILQNLLDNAMKFTSQGKVQMEIAPVEDRIMIRVKDTGSGIRPEEQSRVFERFYQADQARSGDTKIRGTGLGLAIVKHAAERLGAVIRLESKLGLGTTITLTLPPRVAEQ